MIRLTFISDTQSSAPEEFDTDDLAVALSAWATKHVTLKPLEEGKPHSDNRGPDTWLIGFVVERDDARFEQDEVESRLRSMASLERFRGRDR